MRLEVRAGLRVRSDTAPTTRPSAYNWLIQMQWENSRGGGCDKALGGKFYNQ
jgi:hypothetical protein